MPESKLFSMPKASGNVWMEKERNREARHLLIRTDAVANENKDVTSAYKFRTPEQIELTAKLASLGKSRAWTQAYTIFKQAEQKDTALFNAILSVARRCRKFEESLDLFLEMGKHKITQDPITYAIMIDVSGKCNRLDSAQGLWSEYKASGCFPKNDPKTVLISYAAIGNAAAKAGNVSMSIALLEEVKTTGVVMPNNVLYGIALNACQQAGDGQTAQLLLEEIRSSGIKTNAVMYASAIGANQGAPLEIVNNLLSTMQAEGVAADEYVVESYVLTLLGISPKARINPKLQIKKQFEAVDPNRVAAISSALFDAQAAGVPFTTKMNLVMDELWKS